MPHDPLHGALGLLLVDNATLLDPLHRTMLIGFLKDVIKTWEEGVYESSLYRLERPKRKETPCSTT